ncbi:MAG: MarR family winged helix-turn-helix transcriptional regulator [Halopseudomonas aestusnigri]
MKFEVEDVTACTCARLRKATRILTQAYDVALKPSGLKGTQFTLLATLDKTGEIPLSRLADVLGMERTTLTRNLKPMMSKRYIKTNQDDDQRVRLIQITTEGAQVFQEAMPLWQSVQAQAVEKLGRKDWTLLMGALGNLTRHSDT